VMLYTKAQAPSVRFITLFVANVLVCRQQIDQVEFEPQLSRTVCANNRQVSLAMCFKYRCLVITLETQRRVCMSQRRVVLRS